MAEVPRDTLAELVTAVQQIRGGLAEVKTQQAADQAAARGKTLAVETAKKVPPPAEPSPCSFPRAESQDGSEAGPSRPLTSATPVVPWKGATDLFTRRLRQERLAFDLSRVNLAEQAEILRGFSVQRHRSLKSPSKQRAKKLAKQQKRRKRSPSPSSSDPSISS